MGHATTERFKKLKDLIDPVSLQYEAQKALIEKKRFRAFLLTQMAVFVHTARGVKDEEITRRAAALTYHTLLSIVPVIAVAFALFKAFGGLKKVEGPLKNAILEYLAAGRSDEVGVWIDRFIENINAGAIAGVGVIFLFYSALGLLSNVEQAFNKIWGIKKQRPIYMRFAIYWCMLTLAPPLIGLSLSMSARLQGSAFATSLKLWLPYGIGRVLISTTSLLAVCLVFVFLYQLVPNTKVKFRCALLGGIVAGLLWNITKTLFLWITAGSVKYSAVYGALGALPIIMLWTYISWIIVLFGVTYTLANQRVATKRLEDYNDDLSFYHQRWLGMSIMKQIADAFYHSKQPPTISDLAEEYRTSHAMISSLIDTLVREGLVKETSLEHDLGYIPARTMTRISLDEIYDALDGRDKEQSLEFLEGKLADMLKSVDQSSQTKLESMSLEDLVAPSLKK